MKYRILETTGRHGSVFYVQQELTTGWFNVYAACAFATFEDAQRDLEELIARLNFVPQNIVRYECETE
jgi:hypothetical protein